jgi:hypothetical protein
MDRLIRGALIDSALSKLTLLVLNKSFSASVVTGVNYRLGRLISLRNFYPGEEI